MSFSKSNFHYIQPFTPKQEQTYLNPPKRDWKALNQRHHNQGRLMFDLVYACFEAPLPIYNGKGRPPVYSDELIICLASISFAFNLGMRKVLGFVEGFIFLHTGKMFKLPDQSTVSKRLADLNVNEAEIKNRAKGGVILAIDSTGLRSDRRGLHCETKHEESKKKRRYFILHTVVDTGSQEIIAHEVTDNSVGDPTVFETFNDKGVFDGDNVTTIGDGAYDVFDFYKMAKERGGKHIAPPSVDAVVHPKLGYNHPRNVAVRAKDRCELFIWKERIGYHQRSLVETVNHVFKAQFSESLRSRSIKNVKAEVKIKVNLYNKFVQA